MKLNLKSFKKIGSDEHTTTMKNDAGHTVVISHKSLHPATRGQLAALPMSAPVKKMAKGGAVEEKPNQTDLADPMMSDDPQAAMAAGAVRQGISEVGDSPAVKQALDVTGNLNNFNEMAVAAKNGDAVAQDGLAQHNAGIAMGTVGAPKTGGIPGIQAALGKEVTPLSASTGGLQQAQALMKEAVDAGADQTTVKWLQQRINSEMDKAARYAKGRTPMAEGGEVAPTPEAPQDPGILEKIKHTLLPGLPQYDGQPQQGFTQTPEQGRAEAAGLSTPAPTESPQPQMVAAAPQTPPGAPSQAADPYGNVAYQDAYMKGLESEKAGLQQEAQAADTQGQAQAAILGKQQAIQAQQQSEYQRHYQALDSERQALAKDIQDQHIDPNRFLNSQGIGSKIATAIGMIVSGLGAGMSHQSNLAVDFLNKQIDNDIKAQQTDLGKKENLLSANMRQFGNMKDAVDMTRVMQSDILANQLKAEAAKQMGPMAKANLLKAAGDLEMKSAPVLSQIAMRKTLMSGMGKGQVAPEAVIRMIVPEHEQASATKELKEAQNAYRAKDNVLSAFDRVAQINTLSGNATSPIQTRRQVAALSQPVIAALSKETAGRFTEQDAHMLQTLFPSAGDSAETAAAKRTQTVKLITEKLNFPELKKWGIDLSNTGRYDNTGKSRIPEGKPKR